MIKSHSNISHTTEQSKDSGYESNPEYETPEHSTRRTRSNSLQSLPDRNTPDDIKKCNFKIRKFKAFSSIYKNEAETYAFLKKEENHINYFFKIIYMITNHSETGSNLSIPKEFADDLHKGEKKYITQQDSDFSEFKKYIDNILLKYNCYLDSPNTNELIQNTFKKLQTLKLKISKIKEDKNKKELDKLEALSEEYTEVHKQITVLDFLLTPIENKYKITVQPSY